MRLGLQSRPKQRNNALRTFELPTGLWLFPTGLAQRCATDLRVKPELLGNLLNRNHNTFSVKVRKCTVTLTEEMSAALHYTRRFTFAAFFSSSICRLR
jgi:hypothetical protein